MPEGVAAIPDRSVTLGRGGLMVKLLAQRPPRFAQHFVQPPTNTLVFGPKSLGLLKQVGKVHVDRSARMTEQRACHNLR